MKRAWIGLTAVVASAGLLAACATTDTASKTPAQYVEDRQKLMKAHGENWKGVQDGAKAGNWQQVATNADAMANNAKQMPGLFPPGSMTEKSKAKPEIWQRKAEFDAAAKKMETESVRLAGTARGGNAQATGDIIKDFGRNTCGNCHTPFRVPPPRS
ncbi:MAG: cytochrome c [Candidatus Rokubacteria bacterium]|nr:cytochrome c [Candidatus Rokubacteria bacterium]